MTYEDLINAIEELGAKSQATSGELAYLGFKSGSYSIKVAGRPNFVWVRMADSDERTPMQALNLAQVRLLPDLPVRVRKENGVLSVVSFDPQTIDSYFAGTSIAAASTERDFTGAIASKQLLPGLVHPYLSSGSYSMTVQVEGFYYYYQPGGTIQYFETTTQDMTSYIPGTSNQHRYTLVTVDPASNALAMFNGTAKSVTISLAASDITAIDIGDNIPLAAIRLTNGMSAIDKDYLMVDIRPWWNRLSEPLAVADDTTLEISGGTVTATQTYHLIAAQSGTTDDLDTITAVGDNNFLVIQADTGDIITVKHNSGNIVLNGERDVDLTGSQKLLLFYDGSNWVDLAPWRVAWENVLEVPFLPTLFLHEEDDPDIVGYEQLLETPADGTEQIDYADTSTGLGDVEIDSYITPASGLGVTVLSGGTWEFKTYCKVDNTAGVTEIKIKVYKRNTVGTETLLFETTTGEINDTSVTLYTTESIQSDFIVATTDRLVVKYIASTDSAATIRVSLYYEGSTNYSHIHAPSPFSASGGSGDVSGPVSSTDNAIARWDGTGGDTLQDSGVTITDNNTLTLPDSATYSPLNVTERSAAPSSPASGDVYLDDGTNTGSGNPGWRRYTGAAWEDVTAASGSAGALDGLTDVVITSVTDNEVLAYDSGGDWINQTAAEAGLAAASHTHTESDITDLDHTDSNAIHDNVAGEIAAVTEKASPVNADLLLIEDSAASNAKKRVQIGNLPGGSAGIVSTSYHVDISSTFNTTSTSYVDVTGASTSHTFTKDNALILMHGIGYNSGSNVWAYFRIYCDTTAGSNETGTWTATGYAWIVAEEFDVSGSSGSVTIKAQMKSGNGSTSYFLRQSMVTFTIIEYD